MLRSWLRSSRLLGSLVLGSACGPFVVLDDGSDESAEESEADATSSTVSTSTTVGTSSTTSATTSTTSASTTSATTTPTTTGNEPGYCAQACSAVADCLFPGSNRSDWACVDGFCEYVGLIPACDPASCDDLAIGFCTEVDGVSVCATPCDSDVSCIAGFTQCTGHDDAGNSICEAIPCNGAAEGEACFIEGFGQYGVCIDGVCACTDDSQCAVEGWACNT